MIYRRVERRRSYFEKAVKKELFQMSAHEGVISNEHEKKVYLEWASKKELSRKSSFSQNLSWQFCSIEKKC